MQFALEPGSLERWTLRDPEVFYWLVVSNIFYFPQYMYRGYHFVYQSRYHVTPTKGFVRLHFVRITLVCTRFL